VGLIRATSGRRGRTFKLPLSAPLLSALRIGKTSPLFVNRADKERDVKPGAAERDAPRRAQTDQTQPLEQEHQVVDVGPSIWVGISDYKRVNAFFHLRGDEGSLLYDL
jgi:hypothetical protein